MRFFSIFISTACLGKDKTDLDNPNDTNNNDSSTIEDEIAMEKLFVIPERPFDMTWDSDGTMLISADASGKLYRWDGTELTEQVGRYNDIQAVHVVESTFFYTTTDNGVTGALYALSSEPLLTQSSDGTLLRWPVDITSTPDGTILIADYNAGVVFSYNTDGTSNLYSVGSQTPQALTMLDDMLYIGGEDGIWKKEWPNGIATQIDDRQANGLVTSNGVVYASNSQDGVFIVQGNTYPLPNEIGRPSALLIKENVLYVIDQVGRGVWASEL